MNIEQIKEEAKKRFDKDLTDEQAQKWLEAHPAGELQDEELADVAGGGCSQVSSGGRPLLKPVLVDSYTCDHWICKKCGSGKPDNVDFADAVCENCKYYRSDICHLPLHP